MGTLGGKRIWQVVGLALAVALGTLGCGGSGDSEAGNASKGSSTTTAVLTLAAWEKKAEPVLGELLGLNTDYTSALTDEMTLGTGEELRQSVCDHLLDSVNRNEDLMVSAPDEEIAAIATTVMQGYRQMAQDCKTLPREPVAGFEDALQSLVTTLDRQGLDLTEN